MQKNRKMLGKGAADTKTEQGKSCSVFELKYILFAETIANGFTSPALRDL